MPLALVALLNAAFASLIAWVCDGELRASPRGPWSTTAARALLVHQATMVVPMTAWWLWRAPDWSVAYLVNATRAPSIVLALAVVAVSAAGIAGFSLGARLVSAHRAHYTPRLSAALAAVAALSTVVLRGRFAVVTSYVHFRGGLGPTPGERVSAPWWAAIALTIWALAMVGAALSLRARTRALTLRNHG